jgi:predicted CXXCH cytochrome family protein
MKRIKIFLFFFVPAFLSPVFAQSDASDDECFNCHSVVGDEAELYQGDIHFSYGISCAACHGGDPTTDDQEIGMSKEKGFKGIPVRKERYLVCISCHSDQDKMSSFNSSKEVNQYDNLKKSVHFKPTYNNKGPIADCITCHGIHNIVRVNNINSPVYPTKIVSLCGNCHSNASFMKNYNPGLPIDQVAKYKTSTHGIKNSRGDVNVAECASCHGSHEIRAVKDPSSFVYPTNIPKVCSNCHSDKTKMAPYKIATNQYDAYVSSVHGVALLEKGDLGAPSCNDCHGNHGTVQPAVESISKVCGNCHSLNMELFEQSVHKQAFEKENIPECESCHGNHNITAATDELIGVGKNSSCIGCHKEDDKGFKIALSMRSLIDSLKLEEAKAKVILEEANQKGMDVSDATYSLREIRQILIQTRTVLHGFDQDKFNEEIKSGFEITSLAKTEGVNAIDNYFFRRKGLAVSTLIVTLLVIGLYLKIKKLEKEK